MGDLVVELGRGEAGALTGEAETGARVGEGTEEGSWTGTGEGHSGLLAAGGGEGIVPSAGFVSSGKYGSGKKRVPGDFTRITWKRNRDDPESVKTHITCLQQEKCGVILPLFQALEMV